MTSSKQFYKIWEYIRNYGKKKRKRELKADEIRSKELFKEDRELN